MPARVLSIQLDLPTEAHRTHYNHIMARVKMTVYLDAELLAAVRVAAAQLGRKTQEIVEDALRCYLGVDVLERVWRRADLPEAQATDLAYGQLRAARRGKVHGRDR